MKHLKRFNESKLYEKVPERWFDSTPHNRITNKNTFDKIIILLKNLHLNYDIRKDDNNEEIIKTDNNIIIFGEDYNKPCNIYCGIWIHDDEWIYVSVINDEGYTPYKCDGLEGLEELLKDIHDLN